MADKMRKTKGGKPPISQHPIFPAIIALWCGALAGLCSIALRPAVVEQAILATGLDTLVPMAAPPLGATFRIALALAMTGIGALLGGFLALRIVRPRPSARARADRTEMARDEAPASVPAAERAPAGRRRALANMELEAASAQEASAETAEAQESTALETAAPFAQPETAAAPASAEALPETTERGEIAEGILDMREFDLDAYLDSAQAPADEPDAMPAPSEAKAPDAPVVPEDNVAPSRPIPPEAQVFRTSAPSASAPDAEVPAAPGQRLFDAYSQAIAARTAAPGFSLLPHKDEESAESALIWDDTPDMSEPTATEEPRSAETAPSDAPEVLPFAAAAMAEFTAGAGTAPRSGAERIAARELDELSPIELLERLALAMTRRRETEARDAAQETPEEPTSASSTSEPAIPEPYSPETAAEAPPIPTPSAEEEATPPQVEAPEPTPVALARGPFAAPISEATSGPASHEAAQTTAEDAPAAKPVLPAAMRGIDFDAFEDEDDEALPDYIPARHIRAPAPPSAASPLSAPFAAPAGLAPAEPEENDAEEESVLEQGYSSLLGLSRPAEDAPSFVRVEEPEAHDEIEPVVIFPGEEARSQVARTSSEATRPFDATPAGGSEPLAFPRQLQADASHAQPRPFDAPPREDAEETEKALRAALATLQRMSGAA
ncbi:hypothetical protein [Novosphingobium mangrovi (ex Hu et al. 2023)]|uniref:Uncharacterized protein n=1 Tax=Novosphingobium mangrovi (ex Hu et al. 2023) TaxID=2930094 RepID=A0ABT0AAP9_9SPHN|nr:hypothetical protein [Novosphingobium mangrovi (ex Hu et al. 2023)]MCJ1960271.1 hypothetical protein [Novosphingobium mangrovi (ex Hu et al. 2023)]